MDVNHLLTLNPDDQLPELRGEPETLQALWTHRDDFTKVFRRALEVVLADAGRSDLRIASRAFLDSTYLLLIAGPPDLVALASALDQDLAVSFLNDFVRSPLSRHDVLRNVARTPDLFASLPFDGGWVEVVVVVHGMGLLNSAPDHQFTIQELIPLGIDVDRPASRAVLSSALDNNQLVSSEKEQLLRLFPSDAYFRRVIGGGR